MCSFTLTFFGQNSVQRTEARSLAPGEVMAGPRCAMRSVSRTHCANGLPPLTLGKFEGRTCLVGRDVQEAVGSNQASTTNIQFVSRTFREFVSERVNRAHEVSLPCEWPVSGPSLPQSACFFHSALNSQNSGTS
jgi:hypothetical protein